jgi:hypothetical protein
MRKTFLTVIFGGLMLAGSAAAEDRHEGYYYPDVQTRETYVARAQTLPAANREARLDFVTQLTISQSQSPYPPQYAIFAKGGDAQKLIITALDDDVFATLYRARGVMAQMSAYARTTEFFQEHGVEDLFTFYDLLKLLGFTQLTITDGENWAHQITIE